MTLPHLEHQLPAQVARLADLVGRDRLRQRQQLHLGRPHRAGGVQRDDAFQVRPVAGHVRPQGLHVGARDRTRFLRTLRKLMTEL